MGSCRASSGVRSSKSERVTAARVLCPTRADECGKHGDEMRVRLPPIAGGTIAAIAQQIKSAWLRPRRPRVQITLAALSSHGHDYERHEHLRPARRQDA